MVSCPPHAANHSLEEIRKYLNADSLHYLSQAGLVKATGLYVWPVTTVITRWPYDPAVDKHIIEGPQRPLAERQRVDRQGKRPDQIALILNQGWYNRKNCSGSSEERRRSSRRKMQQL